MRTSLARCFWPYSFTMRNISAPLSFPLLALAIASCSPAPPEPAPAPQPPKVVAPAPPVVTQPQGDWIDWPIASGTWVYRKDDRGSLALFGPAGGDALLMVRCNASQRQLILSRAGSVRDSATMVLRASDGVQSYSAGNSGGSALCRGFPVAERYDDGPDRLQPWPFCSRNNRSSIACDPGRAGIQSCGGRLSRLILGIWPERAIVTAK